MQDAAPGAVPAPVSIPPAAKSAVQEWAKLLTALLVVFVGLFTAWWAWWRWKRSRVDPDAAPVPSATQPVSAWEEAGRRMPLGGDDPSEAGSGPPGGMPAGGAHSAETRERLTKPVRTAHDHPPIAMVTGAAKRVGHAIAVELARAGCDIVLTYNKSYDEATALGREISAMGRTVWLHELDLGQPGAVAALADELARTLPRLDILVHNASLYGPTPVSDVDVGDAMRMYEVNALGPLLLTTRLATLLSESPLNGGGCVVALSDIHAQGRPRRNFASYLMSKAALDQMVECLARDLAPRVRVNSIALGVVAWPEHDPEMTPEEQRRYVKRIPLGRAGEPNDAASAVRWLAFDAPYVTGASIRVDGGRWLG